ncbi:MAG: NACHT domain-containing protein, partial [Acidimicrobiales bacterium]
MNPIEWLPGDMVAGDVVAPVVIKWSTEYFFKTTKSRLDRYFQRDEASEFLTTLLGDGVPLTTQEFNKLRETLRHPNLWNNVLSDDELRLKHLKTSLMTCLPPREGLSEDQAQDLVVDLIKALVEFDLAKLNPDQFQHVMHARLDRMEESATKTDEAILTLNADLTILAKLDQQRHRSVITHLKRILDYGPPRPAGRSDLVVYLSTLIESLDVDPWPRIAKKGGPTLTPSALERRLMTTNQKANDESPKVPADELGNNCSRLIILGDPGSGKTWLARRIARRAAETALDQLANNRGVDDIEIPLYATCAKFSELHNDDVRKAAISASLAQMPDLGSTQLRESICKLLEERNGGVVLVLDSLDEAANATTRQLQNVANIGEWRFVLTSRPSSWANQVNLDTTNERHVEATLVPLAYPNDVEEIIDRWYINSPDEGKELKESLRNRPNLASAACVPLILAFYCLVADQGHLPETRRVLYQKVIRRLLVGPWHDTNVGMPAADINIEACESQLQAWAWQAADHNHETSGLGAWLDEIPTARPYDALSKSNQLALSHICTPVGRPDIDLDTQTRRFIHRSIQEHCVAEHVAKLSIDQAADILLPHLWYDRDWENAAPAALAAHAHREDLLKALLYRVGHTTTPADVSIIDACDEFRRFLLRAGADTAESDWPTLAGAISDHHLALITTETIDNLDVTLGPILHWNINRPEFYKALLKTLDDTNNWAVAKLAVNGIVQLSPTAEELQVARKALLDKLNRTLNMYLVEELVAGIVQLSPTAEEQQVARKALLDKLNRADNGFFVEELVAGIVQLSPTAEEQQVARKALLKALDKT